MELKEKLAVDTFFEKPQKILDKINKIVINQQKDFHKAWEKIQEEMAEEKIAERIDANLLNVSLDDLHHISKEEYDRKFSSLKQKTHGKLIIKEYPTASASVANFKHLLDELKIKKRFVPDAIFVDYINICASARIKQNANTNSYFYIKSVAEELRGLAKQYNIPLWTATQVNREGAKSSDMEMTDTSESFGLPQTADFFFALIENEEFREDLYYRLNVFPIEIPPLRERRGDIPILLDHFLNKYAKNSGRSPKRFSKSALKILTDHYDWPGNVKELQNLVERFSTITRGNIIYPHSI